MNPDIGSATDHNGRREYILSELRCALIKARLAQCDIEAVAIALKSNVITPEQAAAMFWDCETVQFLGLEMPEPSTGESGA